MRTGSEIFQRVFNPSALHDLLALFDSLFLSFLSDFPKLIAKDIASLMQFLLGLIIFSHIWILIRKLVEVPDELFENLLLAVQATKECQKLGLGLMQVRFDAFSLNSLFLEGGDHLRFVGGAQLLPESHEDTSKIFVDVVALW